MARILDCVEFMELAHKNSRKFWELVPREVFFPDIEELITLNEKT